jgi:PAS domain S-box-containing protein
MQSMPPVHLLNLISSAYPGLFAYIGDDYKYKYVNDEYQKWFGVDPKLIIGQKLEDLIGRDQFLLRKNFLDKAFQGNKVKFTATINHKSMGPRLVDQIYEPDKAEDGTVKGLLIMAYDITEQKRAEKSAQDNEARFRSLTEVMPQLVWIADGEGNAIFFNHNWPRTTNTTMEENYGHGWLNVLHHEDRVSALLAWKDALKTGTIYETEYRIKTADGSYRWHITRGIPIKNAEGEVERWVGTTTDIEDQKNARQLADREREKFYSLFMQAPVVILVLNGPDHVVEMINPAGRNYINGMDLKGRALGEALPELGEQGFISMLDEIYFSGKGQSFQSRLLYIKQPDGSIIERFYDLYYQPIKDEDGLTTGILNMAVDVTEQVEALRKAEEKEKKLEEALISRDQFLSIASHELKTPLTSLKLQAQLTLRSLELNKVPSLERQTSMANQTSELVGRLTRLIDDMLDVSRINTGKLKLDKAPHEIGDIVREVLFRMSVLFEAAQLKIPSLEINEKIIGEWDRFRLEQVIGNLLTNAIRYGQGKPVEIKIYRVNNNVRISVTDQGYGIASDDLVRIFGRFERAINSAEVSGLGLGLFICKEIVESHDGKIWVQSEIGHGSTFFVELPLKSEAKRH